MGPVETRHIVHRLPSSTLPVGGEMWGQKCGDRTFTGWWPTQDTLWLEPGRRGLVKPTSK
jgi:hypothetical protein